MAIAVGTNTRVARDVTPLIHSKFIRLVFLISMRGF
jgi:hypothetical protein